MARRGYLGRLVNRGAGETPGLAPAPPLLRRWEALQSLDAGARIGPVPPEPSRPRIEQRTPTAGAPPRAPGAERPPQPEVAGAAQPAGGSERLASEAEQAAAPRPPADGLRFSRRPPGQSSRSGLGAQDLSSQHPAERLPGEAMTIVSGARAAPIQGTSTAPPPVASQPATAPAAEGDAGRAEAAMRRGLPSTGTPRHGDPVPGMEPGDPSATGGAASRAASGGEISRPLAVGDAPGQPPALAPEGPTSERGGRRSSGVAGPGPAEAGPVVGGRRSAVVLRPPAPALPPAGMVGRPQETREGQARSQSPNVQIGTLDIHVESPRDPPAPSSLRTAPRPAAALSRGLTSAYGLRQG
jgi:hypothetical protein